LGSASPSGSVSNFGRQLLGERQPLGERQRVGERQQLRECQRLRSYLAEKSFFPPNDRAQNHAQNHAHENPHLVLFLLAQKCIWTLIEHFFFFFEKVDYLERSAVGIEMSFYKRLQQKFCPEP
jgi:hypothetical protein